MTMMRLVHTGVLVVLVASLQVSYMSCTKFQTSQITIMGNPMTSIKVAPYTLPSGGVLTSISVCPTSLTFKSGALSGASEADVRVQFATVTDTSFVVGGTDLGALPVPAGRYTEVTLEVTNQCGGGRSLRVVNGAGTFETDTLVAMRFVGTVEIGSNGENVTLDLQPLITKLPSVGSDVQLASEASSTIGSVYSRNIWTAVSSTDAPEPRSYAATVWTGAEMLLWGGRDSGAYFNTGGRYNVTTNSWRPISTVGAPQADYGGAFAWTGSEMLLWSGQSFGTGVYHYDPAADQWSLEGPGNSPETRHSSAFVWTGTEMIVWGGFNGATPLNTGGRYNPTTKTWTQIATTGAPPAASFYGHQAAAVWTGDEMIVWGGEGAGGQYLNSGGRYRPNTNSWSPISMVGAPSARLNFTPIWTGTELIIWGGDYGTVYADGARYNPVTDTWRPISQVNAPSARDAYGALWTGTKLIMWGGFLTDQAAPIGYIYDPETDSWSQIHSPAFLGLRRSVSSIWTGMQAIFWGGYTGEFWNGIYFGDGGVYTP